MNLTMVAENPELKKQIEEVARPLWEQLIVSMPEVITEENMTFEEFCDEIRLIL